MDLHRVRAERRSAAHRYRLPAERVLRAKAEAFWTGLRQIRGDLSFEELLKEEAAGGFAGVDGAFLRGLAQGCAAAGWPERGVRRALEAAGAEAGEERSAAAFGGAVGALALVSRDPLELFQAASGELPPDEPAAALADALVQLYATGFSFSAACGRLEEQLGEVDSVLWGKSIGRCVAAVIWSDSEPDRVAALHGAGEGDGLAAAIAVASALAAPGRLPASQRPSPGAEAFADWVAVQSR